MSSRCLTTRLIFKQFSLFSIFLSSSPNFNLKIPKSHFIKPLIYSLNSFIHHNQSHSLSYSSFHSLEPSQNIELRDFLSFKYRDSRSIDEAIQLHLMILKHGFDWDLFLNNTLINVYVRICDLNAARTVFDEMPLRNVVTWACLITGYAQNGMDYEAYVLFRDMIYLGFVPHQYAIGSALRACQESGPSGVKFGLQIHGLISKTWFSSDVVVCNSLMSMYASCWVGCLDCVWKVFDEIQCRNSVSWNSIISVYCQKVEAGSAVELLSAMQNDGFRPNEYTFGSLITAASSYVEFGFFVLEQLLASVEKFGFLRDLYVGSALVSGFARFGLIDNARKIFERMSVRNAVSLNGLMAGLVKQKRGEAAVDVFKEMKHLVEINLDSYVILLSSFGEFDVREEGRRKGTEFHAYTIRNGLSDSKVAIGNGLVNMYAKCGDIDYACSVFELMEERDIVSWNSLIAGLDQNECHKEAVENFCRMRKTGVRPSNFALISTLSSCASLGWIRDGKQVHCEGLKLGMDSEVSVSNAFLGLYTNAKNLTECKNIFSSMRTYDQVSWNTMIGALADSDASVLEAIMCFLDMMRLGWGLSRVSFVNVLSATSSLSYSQLCHQIHALAFKYQTVNDTSVENALIACYGKCGEMEDCERVFSRMSERQDEISWNSMISGYIHNDQLPKAMDLVWVMMQNGWRLDQFTFAIVLSACASDATLERGMEVHACQIRACLESDVVVGSALVDMYAKCGRIDYALRFFDRMPVKNVYSWNSMISAYARHGDANEAFQLFSELKASGLTPDQVTFVGILTACSHAGLVKEGFLYFKSMSEDYGLAPRVEHFSCMIDLLGRSGQLDKIDDFINKMPMSPNILIWRTVLGACSRANGRYNKLARKAAEMLLDSEPENAVNYVLLANIYASGGKWGNVAKARSTMRLAAAKKEAGCSWMTMKDGVHVFVAGDNSHLKNDEIYALLDVLQREMSNEGYIEEISLYDCEVSLGFRPERQSLHIRGPHINLSRVP